ncbi:ribbon-helix-helix protein, CopG family [Leptospira sp. 96542]|nr:ribbon-helix-helix protein, CopG family [Leptospira sp. 96542]
MNARQQLSITLPAEMAAAVRAKVASGEYADESEVIRDSLDDRLTRDQALEHWLIEEVVPACKTLEADPSRGLTVEQVRANLAVRRNRAQ